jgi:hypothetical protein
LISHPLLLISFDFCTCSLLLVVQSWHLRRCVQIELNWSTRTTVNFAIFW